MTLVLNGTTGVSAVDGSASTPAIQGNDTNTGVFFPAADTVAIATGGTERARVDSSGNVGIGTSSPGARLDVRTTSSTQATFTRTGQSAVFTVFQGATDSYLSATNSSASLIFATQDTERARIDSSGNLLVGTTSSSADCRTHIYKTATGGDVLRVQNATGSTGVALVGFRYGTGTATETGYITTNGTSTTYSTTSDYRLKEDVAPMAGALSKIAALKPVTYKWKSTGEASEGFIAHELAEVCPDAVSGEKDAVNEDGSIKPQGIDTSFLVATLTAAIQELKGIVDSQAARIAALEGAAQ